MSKSSGFVGMYHTSRSYRCTIFPERRACLKKETRCEIKKIKRFVKIVLIGTTDSPKRLTIFIYYIVLFFHIHHSPKHNSATKLSEENSAR